jgi:excisionase family DNA binding protein
MQLTFEMLPDAFSQMFYKIENIERLLQQQSTAATTQRDDLFSVEQAAAFLKLSVPTIYGLVSRREVPYMKNRKRLYFSKHELTDWIKTGRTITATEADKEADKYLSRKTKGRTI